MHLILLPLVALGFQKERYEKWKAPWTVNRIIKQIDNNTMQVHPKIQVVPAGQNLVNIDVIDKKGKTYTLNSSETEKLQEVLLDKSLKSTSAPDFLLSTPGLNNIRRYHSFLDKELIQSQLAKLQQQVGIPKSLDNAKYETKKTDQNKLGNLVAQEIHEMRQRLLKIVPIELVNAKWNKSESQLKAFFPKIGKREEQVISIPSKTQKQQEEIVKGNLEKAKYKKQTWSLHELDEGGKKYMARMASDGKLIHKVEKMKKNS